jgi:hypothetical protein
VPQGHQNPDYYRHCGQCGTPLTSPNWPATQPMTPQQPGWYDDPNDPNAQRYWDGQHWTPHRQRKPLTQPSPAPINAPRPPAPIPPTNAPIPPTAPVHPPPILPVGSWYPPRQTVFPQHKPRHAAGIAVGVVAIVLAVSVIVGVLVLVTHPFRDDYAYRTGYQDGSDANAYGLMNSMGSTAGCTELFEIAVPARNVNESSQDDYVDGCVAGYRSLGGVH